MKIISLLFLVLITGEVFAGSGGGKITNILVNNSGIVMITTETNANKASYSVAGGGNS